MAGTGAAPSRSSSRAATPIPWWPFISRMFRSGISCKSPTIPPGGKEIVQAQRRMAAKGRRLRPDPVQQTAESRPGIERLTGRTGRVDRGEIPRLERLRRRHRIAVHQGRTPDSDHDLLGNGIDRPVVPDLLRFRECQRADLDQGGDEEVDRFLQSARRRSRSSRRISAARPANGRSASSTCNAGPRCRAAAISPRWKSRNCSPRIFAHGSGRFAKDARSSVRSMLPPW